MKTQDFLENIDKLAQEYEIDRKQVLEALEIGLISGCKRNYQINPVYNPTPEQASQAGFTPAQLQAVGLTITS
ncbi:NusA N-terminal domain-containing protein [Candidatus Phytoplasma sacchari]|uniref:Transcription factor NusA N-terminal domain-containing protein n=1 Tax=Candidatus Phytoplasma sacchari TaxID=2609813 RepID=A0ABY7M178_9MOLU|nr:hypothetical protein O7R10_00160 [Candidatus Phytoplasma sacchari]